MSPPEHNQKHQSCRRLTCRFKVAGNTPAGFLSDVSKFALLPAYTSRKTNHLSRLETAYSLPLN